MSSDVEETEPTKKSIVIFGRDIAKIPCFRNSFIFGISTGFASCLIAFMATSRGAYSANLGYGIFVVSVLGYWFPCRYKYESTHLAISKFERDNRKLVNESENSSKSEDGKKE